MPEKIHKCLRIITINLCDEYPKNKITLLNEWIKILSNIKADILFFQEIKYYYLEKLVNVLDLKILNINNFEETCVLINPRKLVILDNNLVTLKSNTEPIYVSCLHLDDIPSLPEYMNNLNNMMYKYSSKILPLNVKQDNIMKLSSDNRLPILKKELKKAQKFHKNIITGLDNILKLCAKHRLPKLKKDLNKAKKFNRAIIAGDFNEPSHLNLDKINAPVSLEFEKNGFIDSYRSVNKIKNITNFGYTWPAGVLYGEEPLQRIDMIYTKNFKVLNSVIYGGENNSKWISDHKMVITDIQV